MAKNNRQDKKEFKKEFKKVVNKETKRDTKNIQETRNSDIDFIEGRNAVIEALKNDRGIEYIMISKGNNEGSINVVTALAKEKKIVIKLVDKAKINAISNGGNHQGVIAIVTPYTYFTVEDILQDAKDKDEKPFIVILDEIEDPHNLGSIIRSAECCGVHGIIIPNRRSVGVNSTVYKCSVGATEYVKVAKVSNINSVIEDLKKQGVWVYGADAHSDDYVHTTDFSGPVALVIGSEGRGISKLTREKCDKIVKIPLKGKINSLNASVACGMIVYEIMKSRL